jgi:flagellar motor switch protein FliG
MGAARGRRGGGGAATLEPGALSGPQKGAVLCLALGAERSAKMMALLTPHEVESLSREIASMPIVGSDKINAVVTEFQQVSRAVESVARGGVDYAQQILETAVGPTKARAILDRIQEQMVDTGLKRLRNAAPEILSGILRGEHPQTIALILAHLDPRQSSSVIASMEGELAAEVLYRIARMDKISPEMLLLVESGLSNKTDLSLSEEMTLSGGPQAVAKLLNLTGGTLEKQLLEAIGNRNADIAGQIKALMFVFEDLILIDGRGIQRILRDVDTKDLALALKAASDELKQHIRGNMSDRAGQALTEEIEMLGPVRVKDVESAHARIIESVRVLSDAGEIMISGRGGSDDIIQ